MDELTPLILGLLFIVLRVGLGEGLGKKADEEDNDRLFGFGDDKGGGGGGKVLLELLDLLSSCP